MSEGLAIAGDYIVYRPGPNLAGVRAPEQLFGLWFDISGYALNRDGDRAGPAVVATPTGTFEFRDDGACAEIWELNWDEGQS